jgi:hypothetical protein
VRILLPGPREPKSEGMPQPARRPATGTLVRFGVVGVRGLLGRSALAGSPSRGTKRSTQAEQEANRATHQADQQPGQPMTGQPVTRPQEERSSKTQTEPKSDHRIRPSPSTARCRVPRMAKQDGALGRLRQPPAAEQRHDPRAAGHRDDQHDRAATTARAPSDQHDRRADHSRAPTGQHNRGPTTAEHRPVSTTEGRPQPSTDRSPRPHGQHGRATSTTARTARPSTDQDGRRPTDVRAECGSAQPSNPTSPDTHSCR